MPALHNLPSFSEVLALGYSGFAERINWMLPAPLARVSRLDIRTSSMISTSSLGLVLVILLGAGAASAKPGLSLSTFGILLLVLFMVFASRSDHND